MAHALRIDTLQLAEDLEAAKGDPRKTARVIGGAIGSIDISDLATRADITGVKTDIAGVKTVLKGDIKTLETRMEALATKEDMAKVRTELKGEVAEVRTDIAEVRTEIAEVRTEIAEVRTEIAQSTNRAIYTLGGLVTVLFVLDRIIPLFGIAN